MYTTEKVAEAIKKIEEGLTSFLDSEKWKQYLAFQAHFHKYSYGNIILILLQKPDATYVAGFNTWKQLGRYVKKGEKGIAILAPVMKEVRKKDESEIEDEESDGKNKEETSKKPARCLVGFKTTYVFDVSQTDGKPLNQMRLADLIQGNTELYHQLLCITPFPVYEVRDLDGANGCFKGGKIYIVSTLSEAQKAKTLVHEWAHGLMHGDFAFNRKQAELEAESVAFTVCSALGLDTSDYSFGYLASWGENNAVKMLKESADRIQKAANAILSQIEATGGRVESNLQVEAV